MRRSTNMRARVRGAMLVLALAAAGSGASPVSGSAATSSPHWKLIAQAAPTDFHPGDTSDFYEVVAVNDGTAATIGPSTLTVTLPRGVLANVMTPPEGCEQTTSNSVVTVTCTIGPGISGDGGTSIENINVAVPANATGTLVSSFTVSGGGASEAHTSVSTPVTQGTTPVPFGASLVADVTGATEPATQAGSHPFSLTTLLVFNVASVNPEEKCNQNTTPSCALLNAQAKDLEVSLPPGLVGNPTAVPYCTTQQFEKDSYISCPPATQVGEMELYFYGSGTASQPAPVYNIEPPAGQPAELGFTISTVAHIPIFFHLRSDGDYGLTAQISNINQIDPVRMALLKIWGVPSDEAHNPSRESEYEHCSVGGCPSGILVPKPFLRLPTSCADEQLQLSIAGDSWQSPGIQPLSEDSIAGMSGCERLRFNPGIAVSASPRQAGAPAGYDISLHLPQNEELAGLATPDIRDTEVALPEGTVLSPSAADGLAGCSDAQFGLKVRSKGACPSASKVGTVQIATPLLSSPLKGNVYVGAPECSPCGPEQAGAGGMVRVFVEAEGSGLVIKQAGHTRINQSTGQLTTIFREMPQDPVSDVEISLESGTDAPLVNPSACGPASTTANVTPWSALTATSIVAQAVPIEGCSAPGFNPSFSAGRVGSARAGASTAFSVSLARGDGEQTFGRVSVTTPPGLLGILKSVEQCPEAQASTGTCAAGSLIGSGSIVVGPGSSPLTISGSRVYLTGPYANNPFGLSIVTPAQAGPFLLAGNVGNGTEVVRASIAVDPHTSALTVTSDPLPQQLNGVPLDIRAVHIDINREGFMFSPTDCDTMSVTGAIASATGTVAHVSYPFQTTDCGLLPFKPKFSASTQGKTSKKNGASLRVKVVSGQGQANIGKVKVNLPIQLPSRTSTLQKACVDSVFEANPASCSSESVVGHATAVTPVLKSPLSGPAYIVSHAGRSFPDLDIVLQGEGITLILTGNTDIKKGVTSSTFKAVPDAPVSTFELVLPQGPHSILAAFGNLCTSKLNMPTVITGQNGAVVKQTTKIAASGCPKRKGAKKTRVARRNG